MKKAIICDIDGTLANIDHRRHFVDKNLSDCCHANIYYEDHWTTKSIICCGKCNMLCRIKKPDWESFNAAMEKDTVNQWCLEILYGMLSYKYRIGELIQPSEFEILFVTGREYQYCDKTMDFLLNYVGINRSLYKLFMRPTGDYRPDVDIKREIYHNHIKGQYDVLFVLDDRQPVVDMWREEGLVCLQCAKGDF